MIGGYEPLAERPGARRALLQCHILAPLPAMASSKAKLGWKSEHQKAFEEIKRAAAGEVALALPGFPEEFHACTVNILEGLAKARHPAAKSVTQTPSNNERRNKTKSQTFLIKRLPKQL